jgi:ABC-type multidrug transport system fused ATPase/permease subunit
MICNLAVVNYYDKHTKPVKEEINRVMRKQHTRMHQHMNQSTEGIAVVRAFAREDSSQKKTVHLINQTKTGDAMRHFAHEYYHKRLDWMSKILYICVGLACI